MLQIIIFLLSSSSHAFAGFPFMFLVFLAENQNFTLSANFEPWKRVKKLEKSLKAENPFFCLRFQSPLQRKWNLISSLRKFSTFPTGFENSTDCLFGFWQEKEMGIFPIDFKFHHSIPSAVYVLSEFDFYTTRSTQ